MTVKTSVGETESETVNDLILQGETLAPLICSSFVDSTGKECLEEGKYLYKYRDKVRVPPLSLIDDRIGFAKCGIESVELNAYLNVKSNIKKLQYNSEKCFKMHVGKKVDDCPELKINSWKVRDVENVVTSEYELCDEISDEVPLSDVEDQKYLGEILSSNAKNHENIRKQKEKGYIIINQINKILENGFFGKYFFKAAILLRESLFLNSILLNCEVWTDISEKDLKELPSLDNSLLRNILKCPKFTSVPMMFLDLGIIQIKYIIMQSRLMFLYYLLRQNENSLLYQCFKAQTQEKLPGDWICQVEKDFELLKIDMTYDQIRLCTKFTFQKYIKEKNHKIAFQSLMKEKSNQSKCSNVKFGRLDIQEYLKTSSLTTHQKKILFQMRTGTFPVFTNIKFLVKDTLCPCCLLFEDTMEHQLRCAVINSNTKLICKNRMSISDVFSSQVEKQINITIIFEQAIRGRKIILNHIKTDDQ